ncbi:MULTISPECIES: hypothetical protein [unclassified Coleofasciculus]|uniref:hypothetical protein n=1 Tax=unclassified Coleofasciculus TaxID=2692782 RepID=UPI00187F23B6|nr:MULTISPECIES: hypothetical protein [unclassified Coleofasciculus]MBE9128512.1 hypothetical protein [Coleofasciculus sp. LEGE 07081]MBE9151052.1 hypothetical protein [Coleofasciculus sp. LEGE 07092]
MKNIKYFLATQLFIGLLLSGCNLVGGLFNYGNQSNSSAISENNQFAGTNFPLESCGDTLTQDSHAYPLEVYSVTLKNDIRDMEGNRRNVEIIKSRFCPNSSVGGYHEQDEIAQFMTRDKASDFKEVIEAQLDNDVIQVSSPQIIEIPPSQIAVFNTKEEIGEAAGLTESQIEQLISLEEFQTNNGNIRKVKAIVPTYLPPGFKVDEFTINQWGNYSISYKNDHDACFRIFDTGLRGDAPAKHDTIRSIYSHALGYINLGYTESSRLSSGGGPDLSTGFDMVTIDGNGQVVKGNYSGSDFGYILRFDTDRCNQQPSLQELIKVIQSLHLLNPPQTTKPPSTNNPFQSMSFPKESCGDSLPEDPDAYPVEFYPVFIDYSESNLESVQSQFCRDSLKIYRESLDKEYIQVSSFIGRERANQFKEFIQSEFVNVEIGEASIIEAP